MEKVTPVLTTHAGREKCVRIIQYFLMFLIPTIKNMQVQGFKRLIEKLGIIKSNMSLTRKVLRFGMQIPILLGIIKRFR